MKILLICLTVVFLIPAGIFAASKTQQSLHGYGLACDPETVRDVPSPSGKWIARVRHLDCDALAKEYLEEVVLVRASSIFPFLSRDYIVLDRIANFPKDNIATVVWKSDSSLEIQDLGCKKYCAIQSSAAGIDIRLSTTPRI